MKRKVVYKGLFLLPFMLITQLLFAQQPTKEEMEQMQQMMQQMKSDPEMQKAMKQFGMDSNTIEKMMGDNSSSDVGSYYEFDEFQAPKRDNVRIAKVPKKVVSNTELQTIVDKAIARVDAAIAGNNRKMTELLYNSAKSYSVDSLSGMANGLWLTANYLPATYIMGKACAIDPEADNLNNYAAFLVMLGGEELALPILLKLNSEFPQNSTIQNNIGQAWFGLGELNLAEKYLDSAIMTIVWHPQANLTKAVIQQNKGDKAGAIQSLKNAIKGGYSETKENMLRKLGYKVGGNDLDTNDLHMPADVLGFDRWIARMPPFPKNHKEQMALTKDWVYFHSDVEEEMARLQQKISRISQEVNEKMTRDHAGKVDLNVAASMAKPPYLAAKAQHIIKYYTNDKDGKFANQAKKVSQGILEHHSVCVQTDSIFNRISKLENAKVITGEGISNNYDPCPVILIAHDDRVFKQNSIYEEIVREALELYSGIYEASAYYYQYQVSDQLLIDQYELGMKLGFLQYLWGIHPNLDYYPIAGCIEKIEDESEVTDLINWNDLYCDRNISFTMPLTGTWKFTCNTTEFILEPMLLPFEATYKENLETGEIISASASVSIKKEISGVGVNIKGGISYDGVKGTTTLEGSAGTTIGKTTVGPLPVKAGITGGVFVEIDSNHNVSDVGVKGKTDAKPDLSLNIGNDKADVSTGKIEAGGKWSWNAGGSAEGKAKLNSSINPVNYVQPSKK